jgi:hypothetical protein
VQWDARQFGQVNPLLAGLDGGLGWYVPNGTYVVTAAKVGYEDAETTIFVGDNILAPVIQLERIPVEEPIVEPGEDPEIPVEIVPGVIEQLLDSPEAITTAKVSQALTVATIVSSILILSSSFGLWTFLQYLVTSPVLFFAKRRRRNFGIIYNAYTKVPIDLAIVRLYSEQGKLVRTMVTDSEGRYFFKTDPGRYLLKVVKIGYDFPSVYLKGVKEDGKMVDIYTGGIIAVTEKDVTITANIPMDPSGAAKFHKPQRILLQRFLRVVQGIVAVLGIIFATIVFIVFPNPVNGALVVVQFIIFLFTRRLAKPKKRRGWGIVRQEGTRSTLSNTVVRLFEPKYNKLLETTVTDGKGRYSFLAGANTYYVTFEKPGFEKTEIRPIDYSAKEEPEPISVDINMRKGAT